MIVVYFSTYILLYLLIYLTILFLYFLTPNYQSQIPNSQFNILQIANCLLTPLRPLCPLCETPLQAQRTITNPTLAIPPLLPQKLTHLHKIP